MLEWLKLNTTSKIEKLKNLTPLKIMLQGEGYNVVKLETNRLQIKEMSNGRSYTVWVEKNSNTYKVYPDSFSMEKKINIKNCNSLSKRLYNTLSNEFGSQNVKNIR